MSLTGEQIRAGRAILRLDQMTLAKRAGISVETVKRLEKFDGPLEGGTSKAQWGTLHAIRREFELAGLDLEGGGVRWAPKRHARIIDAIVTEVERSVRSDLERHVKRDKSFFDRGAQHVIDALNLAWLLEMIVRRMLPEDPKRQSGEDA